VSLLFIVHSQEIEVGDLGVEVLIEKYIMWLEISVNDPLVMETWRDQRPSPRVMLSHVAHSNF
jgi:hypothetical protein